MNKTQTAGRVHLNKDALDVMDGIATPQEIAELKAANAEADSLQDAGMSKEEAVTQVETEFGEQIATDEDEGDAIDVA